MSRCYGRERVAWCRAYSLSTMDRCPRVVLAPWADRMRSIIDILGSDPRRPMPPLEPYHEWVPVVWRPLWGARGRKGRACRDPRKHAATCKVMP